MNKKKLLDLFVDGGKKLQDALLLIPAGAEDYVPANSDWWSIREHIVHLADSDINNFIRIKSCLAQPYSACYVIQEEAWVENLKGITEDIKKYARVLGLLREILHEFLETVPEQDFDEKYFIRDYKGETSRVSLRNAIEMYTNHVDTHIGFIKRNIAEFLAEN